MTQQGKTDKIAKNGVRIFSSFVESVAGWIFRETPSSDIGIDGEIEVLDENLHSRSMIAKVQIKASDDVVEGNQIIKYPKKKHVRYWQDFCLPVLLVHVDNKKASCYGVIVNPIWTYEQKDECYKIKICTEHDLLDKRNLREKIGVDYNILRPVDFRPSYEVVKDFWKQNEKFAHLVMEYGDAEAIQQDRSRFEIVERHIEALEHAFTLYPWIRGKEPQQIVARAKAFIQGRMREMATAGPFNYS